MNVTIDKYLDASGLLCPEPVMLLHKTVREVAVGEVIEMITTDPSSLRDVPKFCIFLGHELMAQESREKDYRYLIKKLK